MEYKIATHNSATGEEGRGFLSWLVTPFAKCQSKTINEQYDAGCRMFDIRVIKKEDEYYCAHGVWTSQRTALDILNEINSFEDTCFVSITYEGCLNGEEEKNDFLLFVNTTKALCKHIGWGSIAVKYADVGVSVDWVTLCQAENWAKNEQGFLPLNGSSWHTYLPIPWLWKKIYHNIPKFRKDIFIFVDFL